MRSAFWLCRSMRSGSVSSPWEKPGVEGRGRRAQVAHQLHARFDNVGQRAEGFDVTYAMIGGIGVGKGRETPARGPIELAAIDDHAANRGAVAADELRRRVNDDIGAMLERLHQVRRRHGVINDKRQAMLMRDSGNGANIERVQARITYCLRVNGPRALVDGRAEVLRVTAIHKSNVNAELRPRVMEAVMGATIETCRRNNLVASPGQIEQR